MAFHLVIAGARELAADFGTAGARARAGASLIVRASGARLEAGAKARCPVDTGYLQGSISASTLGGGLTVEVGPTASYGDYVESGTSRMAPQPYMGPATDEVEPQFVQAMERLGEQLGR